MTSVHTPKALQPKTFGSPVLYRRALEAAYGEKAMPR
jgi:hypothetical protein